MNPLEQNEQTGKPGFDKGGNRVAEDNQGTSSAIGYLVLPFLLMLGGLGVPVLIWNQLEEPVHKSLGALDVNDLRYMSLPRAARAEVPVERQARHIAKKIACVFDDRQDGVASDSENRQHRTELAYAEVRPRRSHCWHNAFEKRGR